VRRVSFANLKAMLHTFVEHFFEQPLGMRLRPSYFPFTEPSAEVDIECVFLPWSGLAGCAKHSGWLEILGCGMIHPNVLGRGRGSTARRWQGYAFGIWASRGSRCCGMGVDDLRPVLRKRFAILEAVFRERSLITGCGEFVPLEVTPAEACAAADARRSRGGIGDAGWRRPFPASWSAKCWA